MAERTPMVKVSGYWQELPAGDTTAGASGSSGWTISAKTADYTVLAGDSNTIFTNQGASGTVRFTLPVNAGLTPGQHNYKFIAIETYAIEIIMGQGTLHFWGNATDTAYDITDSAHAYTSGAKGEMAEVHFLASGEWAGSLMGYWQV